MDHARNFFLEPMKMETDEVLILRDVPREQAKAEIIALFEQTKGVLYYTDILEKLRLELELVVEICKELEAEGVIEVL